MTIKSCRKKIGSVALLALALSLLAACEVVHPEQHADNTLPEKWWSDNYNEALGDAYVTPHAKPIKIQ